LTSDSLLQPGTTVAGYEIDSLLGRGGMAVVYRATQRSLKRTVALKLLATELSGDASFRERFEREGQLQAAIDHLHIVPVYEAGPSEHGLFLAMRLIAGPTLKQLITSNELDPRRSLRLLAQVAQALDAAHSGGLIHRDVKPQNILVGEGDHAYLADFGLIKAPDEVRLTGTGQFMGTIDYVAPETIRGEASGPASDAYALAALLFECLTGQVPFRRNSEAAVLQAQLTEPPPRITDLKPDLPKALDDVIARGLAKDPAQRPAPLAELIREAAAALAGRDPGDAVAATRPSGAGPASSDIAQPTRASAVPPLASASDQATDVRAAGDGGGRDGGGAVSPASPTVASPGPTAAGPAAVGRDTRVSSGNGPAIAIVAVLAIVAIAAGFLIGHSGRKTASATPSGNLATAGPLQLRYPASWQLRSAATGVPGMSFASQLTLATTASGGTLTAGEVPQAGGPSLLPAGFAHRIKGGTPKPDQVLLGKVSAYRYTDLNVPGAGGPVTVYVVPTTAGVATIACVASGTATTRFADRCGQLAATLTLVGGSAYPLAPIPAYARQLSSVFAQLRGAVAPAVAQLGGARTPAAQASAARAVARAYASAASKLGATAVSPLAAPAQHGVVAALARLARGYTAAARAASSGSASRYVSAGRDISGGSTDLTSALRSLSKLGYRVRA
jgi:hypothetical protein